MLQLGEGRGKEKAPELWRCPSSQEKWEVGAMGTLQSLSLHEEYQGHGLGAAEYLLKEQEQSICPEGGLRQCSVCALKHRVLLTSRSSAQDGPGGTHRSRKALDSEKLY